MQHIPEHFRNKLIDWNLLKDGTGRLLNHEHKFLGAFVNMPEELYRSVDAFSYSLSKELAKSAAHARVYLDTYQEPDPDREMFKAVHLLALEPNRSPDIAIRDGRWSGALKAEVAALKAQGKIVLKQEAFNRALNMAASLNSHRASRNVLEGSLNEVSLFWVEDGVYSKCRIDTLSLREDGIWLGDLKSFTAVYDEGLLGDQVVKNKYYWQMAHYSTGILYTLGAPVSAVFWLFIEDDRPHTVRLRHCPAALVSLGVKELFEPRERYRKATESGLWAEEEDTEEYVQLPEWFLKRKELL